MKSNMKKNKMQPKLSKVENTTNYLFNKVNSTVSPLLYFITIKNILIFIILYIIFNIIYKTIVSSEKVVKTVIKNTYNHYISKYDDKDNIVNSIYRQAKTEKNLGVLILYNNDPDKVNTIANGIMKIRNTAFPSNFPFKMKILDMNKYYDMHKLELIKIPRKYKAKNKYGVILAKDLEKFKHKDYYHEYLGSGGGNPSDESNMFFIFGINMKDDMRFKNVDIIEHRDEISKYVTDLLEVYSNENVDAGATFRRIANFIVT